MTPQTTAIFNRQHLFLTSCTFVEYDSVVAEKKATGFDSSECTRRIAAPKRYFFVRSTIARPLWTAVVGSLRAAGYLVRRSVNPAICRPPRLTAGNGLTPYKEAHMPGIVTPENPLNAHFERFNTEIFQKHSNALASSARALNQAYQTAYSIECMMLMLVADDVERENADDGQPLSLYLRGGLTAAIAQMATSLHRDLCNEADRLDKMLERAA